MEKPTLLVLAAGLGSRYNGQKQIDSISKNEESLMEFALYDALKLGLKKAVFIVNEQLPEEYKNRITEILSNKGAQAHFVEQTLNKAIPEDLQPKIKERKKPLGTAHAVLCAQELIQEPFVTINADDFYGYDTLEKAFSSVEKGEVTADNYSMVAFDLKNTLSDNGTVSRGICAVKEHSLVGVEEYKSIQKVDGIVRGNNDETKEEAVLDENAKVSMNFWVLHPSFFELAKRDLQEFIEENDDVSKIEFYLPAVVDKAIQNNELAVNVLSTDEKWFGLTYRDDKNVAVKEIEAQKEKGNYPEKLWG